MSVKVMSAVWECEELDASERLVMLSLADHADDDGVCYPSIARLCKRTSMSDRGVQKVLTRLQERGFLRVEIGAGRKGSNRYFVTATPEPSSPPNHVHPEHGSPPPRTTFTSTPEPGSPKPSLNHQEPSEEPPLVPQRRKRRMALPPDWVPSDRNIADAEARQFSAQEIDREAAAFRDHHLAKGNVFADWDAAWRTWLGNARKFASGRMAGPTVAGGRGQGGSLASIAARRHIGRAAGFSG